MSIIGFVGYSNYKSRPNKSFIIFVSTITLWVSVSFISDIGLIRDPTLAVKFIYASGAVLPLALVYFVQNFLVEADELVKGKVFLRHINKFVGLIAAAFMFLSFTYYTVQSAVMGDYGVKVNTPGSLLFLHVFYYLAVSFYALSVVLISYRRSSAVEKNKALLMLVGLGLIIGINIVVNGVLIVLGNSDFGPLIGIPSILFFVGTVASSIIKHGLFDVRLIVVRAIAYTLSLSLLALMYLSSVFLIGSRVMPGSALSVPQQFFYLLIALIFALTLPPLRRSFNKVSNRLFYRDAYVTQEVLDQISTVIVGTIDPHKVQKGALNSLAASLRPIRLSFILQDINGDLRVGDTVGEQWNISKPDKLRSVLQTTPSGVVLYDELNEDAYKLKEVLSLNGISVVAPLVTKNEHIGYLTLGPKKSGNIYNSQDVGLLNIASNELAVALQNAQRFEEIQAFNITLQEKVNEATRELKKTNRKLIALDEAKDEFISMASHQLRTPLTSIKGYLSMLSEGDLGKLTSAQQKAIKEAFGSSQRMVFLIADFLNVSRIKTGKFVIELREVDLPQIVSEELSQLKEMAGSRDITLVYDQPGVFPNLKLDDNKIRQVMMNMVDNAIYYTPAGGKVTIQLYVDGSDVVFKVTDTGIGVPKREQHKMFTKFFRAGNAKKARPDGTGLGLFMAQKIIVEQGGSVIFKSTEGKGSTFGFRFPLSKIKA